MNYWITEVLRILAFTSFLVLIDWVRAKFTRPRIEKKLYDAMMIGPMSELPKRLDSALDHCYDSIPGMIVEMIKERKQNG